MTHDDAAARGWALLELGRFVEAATVARTGLATDPTSAALLDLLATALLNDDQVAESLAVAERLVAADPEGWRGHYLRGIAVRRTGRLGESVAALRQAVAADPMAVPARISLVESLLQANRGRRAVKPIGASLLVEALTHADEAVRLAPTEAGPFLARSRIALAADDLASAERWAREALRQQPDHHIGHELLAEVATRRGDARAAGDHLLAAGRANPRRRGAIDSLRNLRVAGPAAGLGAVFLTQVVTNAERSSGLLVAIALFVVLAVVFGVWSVIDARERTREQLSPEARAALERDRSSRRRR